ncbi:putative glucan synthasis protein [Hyella patelloides LEGE 07179]|uniref:Putative glucan synthasis protein n=1 Tax=Hyella patelloides LEGE 07179 TaxID=945734 RepID=A0A563VLS8_9CYAN|nr:SMI1/KNR4 family protein [Hyella patelloides]VEP12371.1 putative glucan synthasis protein [Hyella patelloides LEGE 07179]
MKKKHVAQIKCVKRKLILAKKADKNFRVFGSKYHKYFIDRVVTEDEVANFEQEYKITLPSCYRSFLTQIGNGGNSYANSAAGPFYGIFPLGERISELIEFPEEYLNQPVNIYPGMTDESWTQLTQRIQEEEDISDDDFDKEMGKIYSGILPIGSQGCAYIQAITLNGANKGRVVNLDIDIDGEKPKFAYENNFLDWYERWLDEIISGDLIKDRPTWFGFCMGGTDRELIGKYQDSTNEEYKIECLVGLLQKAKLNMETIQIIEKECSNPSPVLSNLALQLLTKTDYKLAKNKLKEKYTIEPLIVFQCLFWYAKDASEDWIPEIKVLLSERNIDPKLFNFVTYVVKECKTNSSILLQPFTEHENEKIRRQAGYILKELKHKTKAN